jgi:hypothetical protein
MSDPSPTRYRVSVSAIVGKRQHGGADVSKLLRFLGGLRERCRAIRYLATGHLQSHNLKVPGSNPGPATTDSNAGSRGEPAFFVLRSVASAKVIILGRCDPAARACRAMTEMGSLPPVWLSWHRQVRKSAADVHLALGPTNR